MGPEGIRDPGSYSDVKFLAQDSSRCEVTFELPAGYQVTVDISGTCSDYAELVASNPAVEPWPNFLRVDGVQGTIELRGWQVAQYFTRQRNESCLLVYQ